MQILMDEKSHCSSERTNQDYLVNYLIRAEMPITFTRYGPTTQDNQGEPSVSFSVQTPGVLG